VEAHQKDSISGKLQPDIHIRLGRRDDPLLLVYARQFLEHFG
jgi:proteasome assembly chaperone 3